MRRARASPRLNGRRTQQNKALYVPVSRRIIRPASIHQRKCGITGVSGKCEGERRLSREKLCASFAESRGRGSGAIGAGRERARHALVQLELRHSLPFK